MKEFIEKLIERLEENIFVAELHGFGWDGQRVSNLLCLGDVKDISEQLAEEYKGTISKTENVGWIPCSERLPEEGQIVLANVKNPSKYINKGTPIIITEYEDAYFWHNGIIQAWQTLPAPYTPPTNSEIPNWQQQTMNRFERVE